MIKFGLKKKQEKRTQNVIAGFCVNNTCSNAEHRNDILIFRFYQHNISVPFNFFGGGFFFGCSSSKFHINWEGNEIDADNTNNTHFSS